MPIISVIVPVYKVEPYLHRCVDSILKQSFTDFELILVDDGSPDRCGEICDEYAAKDSRIHVIHQKNGGISAARNAGIDLVFANSDSQWISFIDSDDWVHIQYLELLFTANQKHSTLVSQCGLYRTEGDVIERPVEGKTLCVSPDVQYSQWFTTYACGKLYHKSCFTTFRYPLGILFEDVTVWYKILFSLDRISIVDEPLYYYYQRKDGVTNSVWTPAKLAQIDAWEAQLEFARHHGSKPVLQTVLKRYCWVYQHQCEEIEASDRISEKERKTYRNRLLRRLRVIIVKYRKELKEIGIFQRYASWAFPKLDWLYWTLRGIWGKLKRLFTR